MNNKPRHKFKQNGRRKLNICKYCGYMNCDNLHGLMKTPYIRKIEYRKNNGLCIACGKSVCQCKKVRK